MRKQTELAQLEADRKQKELIASTIRPAEAEADAQVKRAEGDKLARIAGAQAEAERVKLAGQAEAAVQVTKGEANARVVLVNAQSEAEKTKLEGNAEAGIVFTKGEAEAKALELRAQAYRQFNEAAVIQTVLSMLPEIVRAAAEPMGRIDQLTVLSNDGASELVRNTTRTVAEASATVKGLTGIDVPQLIGTSMGARFGGNGAAHAPAAGHEGEAGGSGGSGRRLRREWRLRRWRWRSWRPRWRVRGRPPRRRRPEPPAARAMAEPVEQLASHAEPDAGEAISPSPCPSSTARRPAPARPSIARSANPCRLHRRRLRRRTFARPR